MNIKLSIPFKGQRKYIHGTDIFHAMVTVAKSHLKVIALSDINFSIHKSVDTDLILKFQEKADSVDSPPIANLSFTAEGKRLRMQAFACGEKIGSSVPFDEMKLCLDAIFDSNDKSCSQSSLAIATDIEKWVVLHKFLLSNLFPDVSGSWWFVKIELKNYNTLLSNSKIKITLNHNLTYKLIKSLITIDDSDIGFIYFSMKAES